MANGDTFIGWSEHLERVVEPTAWSEFAHEANEYAVTKKASVIRSITQRMRSIRKASETLGLCDRDVNTFWHSAPSKEDRYKA